MTSRLASRPASLWNLPGRASVVLSGKDRVALLQGLVTNDVKKLAPGGGCHAALLTPKGRMSADFVVLCEEERLVLDAEPELAAVLAATLPGYVFFQEVSVADETAETAVLHVEGSDASRALAAAGFPALPDTPHAHSAVNVAGVSVRVVAESRGGAPGFDLRCARPAAAAVRAALGAVPDGTAGDLEASRIEAGIPRWGAELTSAVLPNEALLERDAISYAKGCYIGQETVARIRTYGHVNRLLVRLALEPGTSAAPGTAVEVEGAPAGTVTSVAADSGAALAFVKRDAAREGVRVRVGGEDGTIHPLA